MESDKNEMYIVKPPLWFVNPSLVFHMVVGGTSSLIAICAHKVVGIKILGVAMLKVQDNQRLVQPTESPNCRKKLQRGGGMYLFSNHRKLRTGMVQQDEVEHGKDTLTQTQVITTFK